MAFVSSIGNTNNASGPYISTSSNFNTIAGNTIIVGVSNYTTGGVLVSHVTDTAGNTYVRAGNAEGYDANNNMEIWYATNVSGLSTNIITATFTTNAALRRLLVLQYSGLASSNTYNVSGELSLSPVGTVHETSTVTTTVVSELCIGFYINTGTATGGYTGSSPSIARYNCTSNDAALVEEVQATEGECSIVATTVSSASVASIVRTFKSRNYALSTNDGVYTTSGLSTGTFYNKAVAATTASYSTTGQDIDFNLTYNILEASPGTITSTGAPISFTWEKTLDAEGGSSSISEGDTTITYTKIFPVEEASYFVQGTEVGFLKLSATTSFMKTLTARNKYFSLYARY